MTGFALTTAFASILGCSLLALASGTVTRRLRPAQAVVLLATAAIVLSLACGMALTGIAVAVLATVTSIAANGQWSAAVVRANIPLPGWLGAVAAVAVLVLLIRAAWRVARIALALVKVKN